MRLFIAVNFPEDVKNRLAGMQNRMKESIKCANFSRRENLHLTLAFIGETSRVGELKEIMNRIGGSSFEVQFGKTGVFSRNGGDILWVEIEQNDQLWAVQKQLSRELKKKGFPVEERPFKPHITLAREVEWKEKPDFDKLPGIPTRFSVEKISLMKSERQNGKLAYTEIYSTFTSV